MPLISIIFAPSAKRGLSMSKEEHDKIKAAAKNYILLIHVPDLEYR